MANITMLHWNLETYGPGKYANANNAVFINYIAKLIHNVDAEIVAIVEVKNSVSANVALGIANATFALDGVIGPNPWHGVVINSGKNNEAYIILYRNDRQFLPVAIGGGGALVTGLAVTPQFGMSNDDAAGNSINFPSAMTKTGGRLPFFATFQTTDNNRNFSVISYHAMFGNATANGIIRLPRLNYITQFANPPANTAMYASLISGDFNVDFDSANPGYYTNMINLPTYQATNQLTSMKNAPVVSDDPSDYLLNAYDNVFQTVLAATPTGNVIDLMVESAIVVGPQPAPPAAQPHVGNLSAEAGAFNVANIPNNVALNPVAAVPPADMPQAWAFVREAITNHYPVVTTATI